MLENLLIITIKIIFTQITSQNSMPTPNKSSMKLKNKFYGKNKKKRDFYRIFDSCFIALEWAVMETNNQHSLFKFFKEKGMGFRKKY